MYRKKALGQLEFEDFHHPFGGKLRSDNRWVKLSKIIPWEEIEKNYSEKFSQRMGAPAKPLRMALGALIIKERCGFTDEETVEQLRENPYLQYFVGLESYADKPLFDPSMMVHFRKRIDLQMLEEINDMILKTEDKKDELNDSNDDDKDDDKGDGNKGKLILDATCTPADIRYPTDLSLLNEGREKLEKIIDELHKPLKGKRKKPRTYRRRARKDYLKASKKRKRSQKDTRKAIRKQLGYISRDLRHIEGLYHSGCLSNRQYKNLLVIHELYHQQKAMYDTREHRIGNRIVSISQPHIRPIVRGKASAATEFGAKISLSLVNGFARIENFEWEAYNEALMLQEQVEKYKIRYGVYPESVHVDKLYRTRENIRYCKENNIRISGPPLGRPRKNDNVSLRKKQEKQDELERVTIEGKIGEGKRRYSMSRIMARLPETSETVVGIIFLVMNLEKKLRLLFVRFFGQLIKNNIWRFEGIKS